MTQIIISNYTKFYEYCDAIAALPTAQPLFNFISNIQKVSYLPLLVLDLKSLPARKSCVVTDQS